MPETRLVRLLRPAPQPGGFSDGRMEEKIIAINADDPLPFGAEEAPEGAVVSVTWTPIEPDPEEGS